MNLQHNSLQVAWTVFAKWCSVFCEWQFQKAVGKLTNCTTLTSKNVTIAFVGEQCVSHWQSRYGKEFSKSECPTATIFEWSSMQRFNSFLPRKIDWILTWFFMSCSKVLLAFWRQNTAQSLLCSVTDFQVCSFAQCSSSLYFARQIACAKPIFLFRKTLWCLKCGKWWHSERQNTAQSLLCSVTVHAVFCCKKQTTYQQFALIWVGVFPSRSRKR